MFDVLQLYKFRNQKVHNSQKSFFQSSSNNELVRALMIVRRKRVSGVSESCFD